jgi:MEMO1 family protein
MKHTNFLAYSLLLVVISCRKPADRGELVRDPVDTIGFAQYGWQMDSLMIRIGRAGEFQSTGLPRIPDSVAFRLAICPHDDYTYAAPLYAGVLKHIKAPLVILFGVAHKARALGIDNHLVFESYSSWKEPFGNVPVSRMRDEIIRELDSSLYTISDTLHKVEHSLEAIIPFLQYYNRHIEIVPILIPAMPFEKMQEISVKLAAAIQKLADEEDMIWGKDYAIVISTDAVHYGDMDWGGKNYAIYGADSAGYFQAIQHEMEIIYGSLAGIAKEDKIRNFNRLTVDQEDYREYLWTWCGRYSIPLGMLTSLKLSEHNHKPLDGILIGYGTSIDHPGLPVDDIGMGITAGAGIHHWVGYASLGYR